MSTLAPVKPPQELLDDLSLDAAWERAQDLELVVRRLRTMLKNADHSYTDLSARHGRLLNGVWAIVGKYPEIDRELAADLKALVE